MRYHQNLLFLAASLNSFHHPSVDLMKHFLCYLKQPPNPILYYEDPPVFIITIFTLVSANRSQSPLLNAITKLQLSAKAGISANGLQSACVPSMTYSVSSAMLVYTAYPFSAKTLASFSQKELENLGGRMRMWH